MTKDLAPLVAKANRGGPGEKKINLVISVQEKERKKKQITYKTKENNVRETHIASCH